MNHKCKDWQQSGYCHRQYHEDVHYCHSLHQLTVTFQCSPLYLAPGQYRENYYQHTRNYMVSQKNYED